MTRLADPHRRTAILQAARKVFLQQGYHATRMTDIAEEAGVAAGTLYRYFESKEMLAQALTETFLEHLARNLLPLWAKAHNSEVLPEIIAQAFSIAREHRDILTIAPVNLGEGRGAAIRLPRLQLVKQLASILEQKMDQGTIRRYEPQSLADMVIILIQRLIVQCVIWEEEAHKDYEETVIQMLQLMLF